jgi:hypothetical protein
MQIKTKVYLCRLGTEYHVLRAESLIQANRQAREMGGYVIREAYANEWYEDEDGINYSGDLVAS